MNYLTKYAKELSNYKVLLDDSEGINSSVFSKAIICFDTPLSEDEMNYFNKNIEYFVNIFQKYRSFFASKELQYEIYYGIDDLEEADVLKKNSEYSKIVNDFHAKFKFRTISDEQIIFLLASVYFDQFGDKKSLELKAKDGQIYFTHSTLAEFAPRVREKLSFLISLFFDKDSNLLNDVNEKNEKVIMPREYLLLLDCYTNKNLKKDKYAYLISNKRSISFNEVVWKELSVFKSNGILDNFFSQVTHFLFENLDSNDEKNKFNGEIKYLLEKKEIKTELHNLLLKRKTQINDNFNTGLLNLSKKASLRYNFSESRFKQFFNDIKREKDLVELLQNTEKEKSVEKNTKKKI